jgi:hypothetical protein
LSTRTPPTSTCTSRTTSSTITTPTDASRDGAALLRCRTCPGQNFRCFCAGVSSSLLVRGRNRR